MPFRLTDEEIAERYSELLSDYEKNEIYGYINAGIFYLGIGVRKMFSLDFDDRTGCYYVVVGDHINYRYEIVKLIGQGAYSLVIDAIDHMTKAHVAIKIFHNTPYYLRKWIQERMLYDYLNICSINEKSLSQMLDTFVFRGHGCIVLRLLHHDLFIESRRITTRTIIQGVPLKYVKLVLFSIIKGLKDLHELNLFHGDLKLDNVAFVTKDAWDVALIDLGNSKFGLQEAKECNQCWYYMPPEAILEYMPCGPGLDMWSFACLAFEVITGKVLFAGETVHDQLTRIMEVLGEPPNEILQKSKTKKAYFHENGKPKYCKTRMTADGNIELYDAQSKCGQTRTLPGTRKPFVTLELVAPSLVDLIKKCLHWDANQRITPHGAMYHEWMREALSSLTAETSQKITTNSKKVKASKSVHSGLRKDFVHNLKPTISAETLTEKSADLGHKWLMVRSKYIQYTKDEMPRY